MQCWNLAELHLRPHSPEILHSSRGEARSILLSLPAGESLQEHQVHERAYLVVIDGLIEVVSQEREHLKGSAGFLAVFEPNEPHEVHALRNARLLLILAPWPGDGHPGARD